MAQQHIMVVDDSQVVLEHVKSGLEERGFRVTALDNPLEMSAAIRADQPDLIVLDVMMPLLSGDKVVEILKKYRFSGEIPVVLFSELGEEELEEMARKTEAAGHLKKNGDLDHLAAMIEGILEKA